MISRLGWWTDVCAVGDDIAWAICEGPGIADCPTVRVLVDNEQVLLTVALSNPRMLGLAAGGGQYALVGQAQDGGLIYFDGIAWVRYTQCASRPAVWWNGSHFQFYAPLNDGQHYVTIVQGIVSDPIPNEIGLTSGGIASIGPDGVPIWEQSIRVRTIRGVTLEVTSEANGIVVGQLGGIIGGIQVDAGDPFVALPAAGMEPRLAFTANRWACASWTQAGQACYNVFPPFQVLPAAPPAVVPTFAFTHPVTVAVFKDPTGATTCPMEVVVNSTGQLAHRPYFAAGDSLPGTPGLMGIYSEGANIPDDIRIAGEHHTRLVMCHDGPTPFPIPSGLRAYDQLWLELYPVVGEPLDASRSRWHANLVDLLARWPGDVGVVPAFYCQGGALPDETWPVGYILDCLASLSDLVNLSPRVKVIAPFSYSRANGIIAHEEFQQALTNLIDAASGSGLASFLPVSAPSTPTPTPHPPTPDPPSPTPLPYPEDPIMSQLAFSLIPLKSFSEPLVFDQVVSVEAHPDGDGLSALKFPDGYASWSGAGWDVHKPSAGAWERFKVNAGTVTAYRDGQVAVFACQPIVVK